MITFEFPSNDFTLKDMINDFEPNHYSISRTKGFDSIMEVLQLTIELTPLTVALVKKILKELKKRKKDEISIKIDGMELKQLSEKELTELIDKHVKNEN